MISIFLDLIKGIISRLKVLSPKDSFVIWGVTRHARPCLDCWVVTSTSWNLLKVCNLALRIARSAGSLLPLLSLTMSPLGGLDPPRLLLRIRKFWKVNLSWARGLPSTAIFPKFCHDSSSQVLVTLSEDQSDCQEPHSASPNPVWVSTPNLATAASYSSVFSIMFAFTRFVSVQTSDSGFIAIDPE